MFSKSHFSLLALAAAAAQSSMANPIPVIGVQALQPQIPHLAPTVVKPMPITIKVPSAIKSPVVGEQPMIAAIQAPREIQKPAQVAKVMEPSAPLAPTASQATQATKLAAVLSEIPVLKAEAEAARLKADILKASQNSGPGDTTPPQLAARSGAFQMDAGSSTHGWRLVGISGYNGHLTAEIRDAAGRKRSVVTGQRIESGWKVGSITASHVLLIRGKQRLRLGV